VVCECVHEMRLPLPRPTVLDIAPSLLVHTSRQMQTCISYDSGWVRGILYYVTDRPLHIRFHIIKACIPFGGLNETETTERATVSHSFCGAFLVPGYLSVCVPVL